MVRFRRAKIENEKVKLRGSWTRIKFPLFEFIPDEKTYPTFMAFSGLWAI